MADTTRPEEVNISNPQEVLDKVESLLDLEADLNERIRAVRHEGFALRHRFQRSIGSAALAGDNIAVAATILAIDRIGIGHLSTHLENWRNTRQRIVEGRDQTVLWFRRGDESYRESSHGPMRHSKNLYLGIGKLPADADLAIEPAGDVFVPLQAGHELRVAALLDPLKYEEESRILRTVVPLIGEVATTEKLPLEFITPNRLRLFIGDAAINNALIDAPTETTQAVTTLQNDIASKLF